MMDIFNSTELANLLALPRETGVTIYMPTNPVSDKEQDPVRLRNMLKEAAHKLSALGVRGANIESIMAHAEKMVENPSFWRRRGKSLAIYATPDFFTYYRTPNEMAESITVGTDFNFAPMTRLLYGSGRYYVLNISEHRARLLECTREGCRNATPENMPKSEAAAVNLDTPDLQRQYHDAGTGESRVAVAEAGSRATVGAGAQVWHSTSVVKDMKNAYLAEYFKRVDHVLKNILKDPNEPLVLAAVGYLHPIFRSASTVSGLLREGLSGNFDDVSEQVLHEKTWPLVEPIFSRATQQALDDYHLAASKGLASSDPAAVINAASDGRIGTLFVAKGKELWGSYDPAARQATLAGVGKGTELVNFAAMTALSKRASVYTIEPDQMPDKATMAAEFRY